MARTAKLALAVVVALAVSLLMGWIWGRTGRAALNNELEDARLTLAITQTRAHVLGARVGLYTLNFGDASRQLEDAKAPLAQARTRLDATGQTEAARRLDEALKLIDESQQLAGRLDQAAQTKATEALTAIDDAARAAAQKNL